MHLTAELQESLAVSYGYLDGLGAESVALAAESWREVYPAKANRTGKRDLSTGRLSSNGRQPSEPRASPGDKVAAAPASSEAEPDRQTGASSKVMVIAVTVVFMAIAFSMALYVIKGG